MIEFTKDEAILMYKSIHPEAYALSASFSDDDLEKNRVTAVDVDTVTYEDFDYVLRDLFNNCVEKKYIDPVGTSIDNNSSCMLLCTISGKLLFDIQEYGDSRHFTISGLACDALIHRTGMDVDAVLRRLCLFAEAKYGFDSKHVHIVCAADCNIVHKMLQI